jgi:hypothetical protein
MSEHADNQRAPTDEDRARALLEQLSGVHAVDVARDMALGLVNFSSTKLGLSDETRPVRDLDDVRLSIELLRAVVAVLDGESAGGGTHDLHDALAQLQLAYAHAVQLVSAERAAEAEEAETATAAAGPGQATAATETAAATGEEEPPDDEARSAGEPAAAKKPATKRKTASRKKPVGES